MIANSLNAATTGIQSLTSGGVWGGVTITPTSNQTSVSNGDGTGGNPTIALTSTIYISGISWNSGTNSITSFTEGTWTPSLALSTPGTSSFTYTAQVGRYYQLGITTILTTNIILSNFTAGTGSGNVVINTCPITPNKKTEMTMNITNTTLSYKYLLQIVPASTTLQIAAIRSGSTSIMLNYASLSNTTSFKSCGLLLNAQ